MTRNCRFERICAAIVVAGLAVVASVSVRAAGDGARQDKQQVNEPTGKKRRDELKSAYKEWVEGPVSVIMTEEERRAFKALKTDEERDGFIALFWRNRDPDPDTPENEYKDEHDRRVQYANEKFSSGIPGWRTDRGRIYIKFGKPDEIEPHPAGGPYERPSYEGGGSTSTYPFEVWWYRHLEGVGSDIEIEFVDPSGSGEYHIARSPNEKDALLNVPGAGLDLAESLGLRNKADRVAGFGGPGQSANLFGARAKDQPFERLDVLNRLEKAPSQQFPELRVRADVPEIATDVLPFSVRTDFFRLSGDSVATSFTMQFDHADLSFKDTGGLYSSQINIYARLRRVAGSVAGVFEDTVQTARYDGNQLQTGQTQRSVYQKNLALTPGRYKIDVVARDTVSGKTGVLHHSFEVPHYQEKSLSSSSLILATSIEPLDNQSIPAGQFIIGRYRVRPHVSAVYKPGQSLALFLQVYAADMDQATLLPALRVEYSVHKGADEILHVVEDGGSKLGVIDVKGQQLTIARAIPLTGAMSQPGTYTVKVKVTDLVSQKVITPEATFNVISR